MHKKIKERIFMENIFTKKLTKIFIAIIIMAISINVFLSPHDIAAGGISGLGILLERAFDINRSLVVMIVNVGMLGLAYLFLGNNFFIKSIIGSLFLPIALFLVPEIMVIQNRLLSVLLGSVIFALAVTILYQNESSSGGTTIPPLIFEKYFNLNTSIGLLMTDLFIVFFNIFIFGVDSFFFAILSLIITSFAMKYIDKKQINLNTLLIK
ncbi:YitT family protein [Anaerosphaera multitolerans]|nr:YitT family protein [Anaerosphaera multitolerans]